MSSARELAQRILRHSPLAAAGIISAVTRGINASIGEGLLMEGEQFARLVPSHDLTEGLEAWKARRAPIYAGR
jgi:enoyl-CoA hydratase/carnithine racemase